MAKTNKNASGTLGTLKAGSRFTYGGQKWILLELNNGAALCLAHDVLKETRAFDENECNDWTISTLREWLNEDYINELISGGAERDAFMPMVVDLTSDDGLKDYGSDTCKIALISDEQYRRFRTLIPAASNWWWTITPWSTPSGAPYSYIVRGVSASGALDSRNAYYGICGVRPLCNLLSSILVSYDPAEVQREKTQTGYNHADDGLSEFDAPTDYEDEEMPEPQSKAAALDMIRHIAAAWELTPEEVMEVIKKPPTEGGGRDE
jgi:hypothetical protein